MRKLFYAVAVAGLWAAPAWAAEQTLPEAVPLEEKMRSLDAEQDKGEKLRRARDIIHAHRLSSLQAKAIAVRLGDDEARLEFATAAYPRVVDPENFYEVYDAFSTFSKVMRLHDRVQQFERVRTPPPVERPPSLSDQEFKEIMRALKRESFDQTRMQLARQIIGNSRKLFLSAQVRELLNCFDFEPSKLEIAKYAYDHTLDREKYFLVNEAFTFDNSTSELTRYVQSRDQRQSSH